MIRGTIKFFAAALAVYGAYKAVKDFLDTEMGGQLQDYVKDAKSNVMDNIQEVLSDVKEEVDAKKVRRQ